MTQKFFAFSYVSDESWSMTTVNIFVFFVLSSNTFLSFFLFIFFFLIFLSFCHFGSALYLVVHMKAYVSIFITEKDEEEKEG